MEVWQLIADIKTFVFALNADGGAPGTKNINTGVKKIYKYCLILLRYWSPRLLPIKYS